MFEKWKYVYVESIFSTALFYFEMQKSSWICIIFIQIKLFITYEKSQFSVSTLIMNNLAGNKGKYKGKRMEKYSN